MKLNFLKGMRQYVAALSLLMMATVNAGATDYDANGFSTDEKDPYEPASFDEAAKIYKIGNAGQLYWYAMGINDGSVKNGAELTKDITVNSNVIVDGKLNENTEGFRTWTPIGTPSYQMKYSFNGNNHSIKGLYIAKPCDYAAFLGFVLGNKSEIKDLTIADSYFEGTSISGGVIGLLSAYSPISISNCHFYGIATAQSDNCGGIVGFVSKYSDGTCVTISNCSNHGVVSVASSAYGTGGICGMIRAKTVINNCYNASDGKILLSGSAYGGGIVGYCAGPLTITGSHNDGLVEGFRYIAGIVGYDNSNTKEVNISQCYNSGKVSADGSYQGGIIGGTNSTVNITNCYNIGSIEGETTMIGGIVGSQSGTTTITNCYVAGSMAKGEYASYYFAFYGYKYGNLICKNNYTVLPNYYSARSAGKTLSSEMFENGAVAFLLRNGEGGSVWGQNVGSDATPVLSGELLNATYSANSISYTTYDGDKAVESYQTEYISGIDVTLPTSERDGYTFLGWYDNDQFTGETYTNISADATGDKAFYAKYGKKYGITFKAGDQDYEDSYTNGVKKVLMNCFSTKNIIFNGWYNDEALTDGPVYAIGEETEGDKVFYAKWLEIATPKTDEKGTYLISNAAELYGFAAIVNGSHGMTQQQKINGRLTKDITVNEGVLDQKENGNLVADKFFMPWEPIGYGCDFMGILDGDGHSISGLFSSNAGYYYTGLVGSIDYTKSGEEDSHVPGIKNLTLKDSYFKSGSGNVGGICAYCYHDAEFKNLTNYAYVECNYYNGANAAGILAYCSNNKIDISNCVNYGKIYDSNYFAAGIIANSDSECKLIKDCINYGDISGRSYVGGIVGSSYARTENCKNYGNIYSRYLNCGGIMALGVGAYNCHNYGKVYAESNYVAGIIAYNTANNDMDKSIKQCSNHGEISGSSSCSFLAGVIANNDYKDCIISECYNTGDVISPCTYGYVGGIVSNGRGTETPSIVNCYNTGNITGAYYVGGISGNGLSISSVFNTGKVTTNTTYDYDKNYVGSIVGYCSTKTDPVSGEDKFEYTFTNVYNNSDYCSQAAVRATVLEGVDMNTIQLCNGTLPAGFDSEVWTAGSIVTDAENKTVTFNLPYLTRFGKESQLSLKATYVVSGYTDTYRNGESFVKDGSVTFTLDNSTTFGAMLNSETVAVTEPELSGASVEVQAVYGGAVKFSYTIAVEGTPTGINNIGIQKSDNTYKTIENGRVVIVKDGMKFDLMGRKL